MTRTFLRYLSSPLRIGLLLFAFSHPLPSDAAPIRQRLDAKRSKVLFGVQSPNPSLAMNGSFRSFSGDLELDPNDISNSAVEVSLDLGSAQLPPDQVLQNVFLQTALSRIPQKRAIFRSDSIVKQSDGSFLVSGTYEWLSKVKRAVFPVQIAKVGPSLTEVRLLMNGSLKKGGNAREVTQIVPMAIGSQGWAKATLVFQR